MRIFFLLTIALHQFNFFAQVPPKVYINIVSHNETGDILDVDPQYSTSKGKVIELAAMLQSYNAKWNLQTCDRFVVGALNVDDYSDNVFRTLSNDYSSTVEIDPRSKTFLMGNNIADTYHLLDSAGANPTTTLGGFIYSSTGTPPIDWQNYQAPKYSQSAQYPTVEWNCNIIWGAGSPNHSNDLHDWGIWKPKTASSINTFSEFYQHESTNNLWYIGSGCPPDNTNPPANPGSFDPTDNVSDVTTPLKNFIDSIQSHLLPWDKFYSYSITINQSDFGPTLFGKIQQICDSVEYWGNTKIEWATLTEKLELFESWSTLNNNSISQWQCNEEWPLASYEDQSELSTSIEPNPAFEKITVVFEQPIRGTLQILNSLGQSIAEYPIEDDLNKTIDLTFFNTGTYLLQVVTDNGISIERITKL